MPGPGAYTGPKTETKGFHIGVKLKQKVQETSPGPAAYNPSVSQTIRAEAKFGIHGTDPIKKATDVPAPGAYSPKLKQAGKMGVFGNDGRKPDKDMGVPGPGHYKIPVQVAWTPKYAIPG